MCRAVCGVQCCVLSCTEIPVGYKLQVGVSTQQRCDISDMRSIVLQCRCFVLLLLLTHMPASWSNRSSQARKMNLQIILDSLDCHWLRRLGFIRQTLILWKSCYTVKYWEIISPTYVYPVICHSVYTKQKHICRWKGTKYKMQIQKFSNCIY